MKCSNLASYGRDPPGGRWAEAGNDRNAARSSSRVGSAARETDRGIAGSPLSPGRDIAVEYSGGSSLPVQRIENGGVRQDLDQEPVIVGRRTVVAQIHPDPGDCTR
jgi:hypothetical protein